MKTHKTFQQLFDDARKSPIYHLEGIILDFERRIFRLKKHLKGLYHRPYLASKIEAQIKELKRCIRTLEKTQDEVSKTNQPTIRKN